jgi:hypothetical protein
MALHFTFLLATAFFTSYMSCHTSERLARTLVLPVFAVLIVGLVSTSIGEEAEVPIGGASAAASPGSRSTTGIKVGGDSKLMSRSWLGGVGVNVSVTEESRTQRGLAVNKSRGRVGAAEDKV